MFDVHDATTGPVAGLDDDDVAPRLGQLPGGRETGEPGPHDDAVVDGAGCGQRGRVGTLGDEGGGGSGGTEGDGPPQDIASGKGHVGEK